MNKKDIVTIFIWSGVILVALGVIAPFIYETFYIPPDFSNLSIKKGKLIYIGECKHRRKSSDYISAKISVDGVVEDIKLPCNQQVSLLIDQIGESVEFRYDPRYLTFLSRRINILHVSAGNRVYYDYHIEAEKLRNTRKNNLRICI